MNKLVIAFGKKPAGSKGLAGLPASDKGEDDDDDAPESGEGEKDYALIGEAILEAIADKDAEALGKAVCMAHESGSY